MDRTRTMERSATNSSDNGAHGGAPRLGRRAPQPPPPPSPPDPEGDIAKVLGDVRLPCSSLVLVKAPRSTVRQRFGSLLERILPTEHCLPVPVAELTMLSISSPTGPQAR